MTAYTLDAVFVKGTEPITKLAYGNGTLALVFGPPGTPDASTLSVNLEAYGLVPEADQIYVKNYGEGEGLVVEMVSAGIATIIETVKCGHGTFTLMRVMI